MARIGLCEDDPAIRRVVAEGMRLHGHEVVTAYDGGEAVRRFSHDLTLDALILDIGLPDADGRDVALALRSNGQPAPILFLTALGQLHDRLAGFAAGADDYLAKPFSVAELVARVEALTRRRSAQPPTTAGDELVLDPGRHAVRCGEHEVKLTPTEFRMLAAITSRPGEVARRRAVVAAAWPDGAIVAENTIDAYAARIRRKLKEVGSPLELATVRGVGFELR
ncbi:response regulator transcription factor [Nocardioides sp. Kera G14]|uniref:response regulator transcription factor n=1 Tax=Nocardioides sp. Kera G14 TaxID=2884264 RepID=UPI001D109B66|nr:response regulator transcription factor [Nocardioides sp. Kera G14]UDY23314.1 response regulator transcription factor [Nocardioides sp. Kera G14]